MFLSMFGRSSWYEHRKTKTETTNFFQQQKQLTDLEMKIKDNNEKHHNSSAINAQTPYENEKSDENADPISNMLHKPQLLNVTGINKDNKSSNKFTPSYGKDGKWFSHLAISDTNIGPDNSNPGGTDVETPETNIKMENAKPVDSQNDDTERKYKYIQDESDLGSNQYNLIQTEHGAPLSTNIFSKRNEESGDESYLSDDECAKDVPVTLTDRLISLKNNKDTERAPRPEIQVINKDIANPNDKKATTIFYEPGKVPTSCQGESTSPHSPMQPPTHPQTTQPISLLNQSEESPSLQPSSSAQLTSSTQTSSSSPTSTEQRSLQQQKSTQLSAVQDPSSEPSTKQTPSKPSSLLPLSEFQSIQTAKTSSKQSDDDDRKPSLHRQCGHYYSSQISQIDQDTNNSCLNNDEEIQALLSAVKGFDLVVKSLSTDKRGRGFNGFSIEWKVSENVIENN